MSSGVAKLERARVQEFQKGPLSSSHRVRLGPCSDGPACECGTPCTPPLIVVEGHYRRRWVGQFRSLAATCGRDCRDDRRSNKFSYYLTKLSDDEQS